MDAATSISIADAYRAMHKFLENYWVRGLKSSDDIAILLGSMSFSVEDGPEHTADPAQWNDWLNAVKATK